MSESLLTFTLDEVPQELTTGLPKDAGPRRCLFWVAREGSPAIDGVLAAIEEPDIDHVDEAMRVATAVGMYLRKKRFIPPSLGRGPRFSLGFHAGDANAVRAWFEAQGHTCIRLSDLEPAAEQSGPLPSAALHGDPDAIEKLLSRAAADSEDALADAREIVREVWADPIRRAGRLFFLSVDAGNRTIWRVTVVDSAGHIQDTKEQPVPLLPANMDLDADRYRKMIVGIRRAAQTRLDLARVMPCDLIRPDLLSRTGANDEQQFGNLVADPQALAAEVAPADVAELLDGHGLPMVKPPLRTQLWFLTPDATLEEGLFDEACVAARAVVARNSESDKQYVQLAVDAWDERIIRDGPDEVGSYLHLSVELMGILKPWLSTRGS